MHLLGNVTDNNNNNNNLRNVQYQIHISFPRAEINVPCYLSALKTTTYGKSFDRRVNL